MHSGLSNRSNDYMWRSTTLHSQTIKIDIHKTYLITCFIIEAFYDSFELYGKCFRPADTTILAFFNVHFITFLDKLVKYSSILLLKGLSHFRIPLPLVELNQNIILLSSAPNCQFLLKFSCDVTSLLKFSNRYPVFHIRYTNYFQLFILISIYFEFL